jgi:hypothetical protein
MDYICDKLGAKSYVGFEYKPVTGDCYTAKKGKILPSGLVATDDKPITLRDWVRQNHPSKKSCDVNFKSCFLVDIDGGAMPYKLDLFSFRRGKSLTAIRK